MSRTYFSSDGQSSAPDQYQQFTETTSQPLSNQSPSHDSTGPTGAPEGYSLVYGDNAFPDTDAAPQYHTTPGTGESPDGSAFEDRLRSLMRRQGDELRAFAEREGRNIDEIRSQAAGMATASPHEFLYTAAMQPLTPQDTITRMDAALEHLHQALGYDGFLAVVTPVDADGDGGITAGTKIGLEFWKGLRGGGLAGLKSLKLRCKANRENMGGVPGRLGTSTPVAASTASRKSLDIKQELNSAMRNALREAAGDPLAEMRWTKPEQLEGYGVRIIGWPPEIALRNPSNNPVRDNKTLLQLLKSGQLRFVRKDSSEWEQADPGALVRSTAQAQAAAQAQNQAQGQPQHIPAGQFVSPQPPIPRAPSAGFIHPHSHPHSTTHAHPSSFPPPQYHTRSTTFPTSTPTSCTTVAPTSSPAIWSASNHCAAPTTAPTPANRLRLSGSSAWPGVDPNPWCIWRTVCSTISYGYRRPQRELGACKSEPGSNCASPSWSGFPRRNDSEEEENRRQRSEWWEKAE